MLTLFPRTLLFSRSHRIRATAVDDLCAQFNGLSINKTRYHTRANTKWSKKLNKNAKHTTRVLAPDLSHLDIQGSIKTAILNRRKNFLAQHDLLQDECSFEGRLVYCNKHLYDFEQTDMYGRTNVQRMLKGLCPIAKDGKDLVVIHHFDQTHLSMWIIVLDSFHREHDLRLHSQVKIAKGVNRNKFAKERTAYWQYIGNRHLFDCQLNANSYRRIKR